MADGVRRAGPPIGVATWPPAAGRLFAAGALASLLTAAICLVVMPGVWGLFATLLGLAAARWLWRRRAGHPLPGRRLQFTRDGRYFVALTLGVGFAAINTGNNLLFLILGMLLSLIVVSGVLSEASLRRLDVLRQLPGQAFAGRPFLTGITLANEKRRLPSYSIEVEDVIASRPLAKKCYFLKIPATARQHTSYRGELRFRGEYRYEGFLVSTRFPFALFRKSRYIHAPVSLLVMPRILPIDRLPASVRSLAGETAQPRLGLGREFFGLREYRLGDDGRDIHWKRSARMGRLVVREYAREGGRQIAVLLNSRVPPGGLPDREDDLFEELEHCVDLTASLIAQLCRRGLAVELVTAAGRVRVATDGSGLNGAMRMLALIEFVAADQPLELRAANGAAGFVVTHTSGRELCRHNLGEDTELFEIG